MVVTSPARRRTTLVLAFLLLIPRTGSVAAQQGNPHQGDHAAPPPVSAFSSASIRRAVMALTDETVIPPPQDTAARGDWADVRRLATGTEILVKATGLPDGVREVVAVDDRVLVVLNLEGVEILREASGIRIQNVDRRALMAAALGNIGIDQGQNVRLEPGGVFVNGRRVMALQQLLLTIPRTDVREITRQDLSSGGAAAVAGVAGGVLGFLGGAMLGVIVGGVIGGNVGRDSDSAALTGIAVGMLTGGIAGAVFLASRAAGPGQGLVYRAGM